MAVGLMTVVELGHSAGAIVVAVVVQARVDRFHRKFVLDQALLDFESDIVLPVLVVHIVLVGNLCSIDQERVAYCLQGSDSEKSCTIGYLVERSL